MDGGDWLVIGGVTGIVAAVTGVVALVWQVIAHRGSGRRVTVRSSYFIPVYGPPNAPQFRDDDAVAITVTNRGGAPVAVTNYGVRIKRKPWPLREHGNLFVIQRPSWATPIPAVVQPGGEPLTVLVPVADLRRLHNDEGVPYRRMRGWVDLGDGRRVQSENKDDDATDMFAPAPIALDDNAVRTLGVIAVQSRPAGVGPGRPSLHLG